MIKGSIQQEDITFINVYSPQIGTPRYIKQILMDVKGEIKSNTILVGDFDTPYLHQWIDYSGKKINKEATNLNDTFDQMDLADIYGTFHPKAGWKKAIDK